MRALLRYLFLKHAREGSLIGLLVGPALMLVAPFLLFVLVETIRGRFAWPLQVDNNLLEGIRTFPEIVVLMSGVGAAAAGFYAFGREAAARSLGSIVLASSPGKVVTSAAVAAAGGATVAWAIAQLALILMRSAIARGASVTIGMNGLTLAALALVVCATGASVGVVMLSIAPSPTMMVPAYIAAMVGGAYQMKYFGAISTVLAAVEIALCLGSATWLVRRRCAA